MSSGTLRAVSCIAGVLAVSAFILGAAVSAGSPSLAEGQSRYKPVQSFSQDFGSKSLSGYFISQDDKCLVTLMVIERSDPETPTGQSATRVRLALEPGQVAGLDSEEGRSLNVTCGEAAASLILDVGDREQLAALQAAARHQTLAQGRSSLTQQ